MNILFGFSKEKGFTRVTKNSNWYFCRKSDLAIANFTLNKIIPINLYVLLKLEIGIFAENLT